MILGKYSSVNVSNILGGKNEKICKLFFDCMYGRDSSVF